MVDFVREHIVYRFGIPQTITTDQGTIFTSEEFRDFATSMCLHQNLEEGFQRLKSSQNHVSKRSIACRLEIADSDVRTGIGFPEITPADND